MIFFSLNHSSVKKSEIGIDSAILWNGLSSASMLPPLSVIMPFGIALCCSWEMFFRTILTSRAVALLRARL